MNAMSTTMITIEEAQAKLPEIIHQLGPGEGVVITAAHRPVAELRPVVAKPQPVYGSCRGMLTINSDDKEHLEDFKEYMP
jgi:antitoxin (DNA-binding transcriptional repressor) of toxin-antitoxin stability system